MKVVRPLAFGARITGGYLSVFPFRATVAESLHMKVARGLLSDLLPQQQELVGRRTARARGHGINQYGIRRIEIYSAGATRR